MNKIKDLVEQAQEYAEYVTPQGCEWFNTFNEKFAELIVRACCDILEQDVIQYEDDDERASLASALWDSKYKIERHFGIE
jgi:hypothetical protein